MNWTLGAKALAFAWVVRFAAAQVPSGSSVSFAYPPKATANIPSLTVNILDTIVVQWTSSFDQAWLYFYCNSSATGNFQKLHTEGVPSSGNATYSASEQTKFADRDDWTTPLRCHFDLNYRDQLAQGINGPVITVTSLANKAEATTFSLDPSRITSASASLSLSSSILSSPTASQTSGATPPESSNGSGGLSSGAIAGIVIGAIVGVLAIAGLGFMLYRNHRKMKDLESKIPKDHSDEYKPHGVAVAPPVAEIPDHQTYEAPSGSVKYANEAPPQSPRELG